MNLTDYAMEGSPASAFITYDLNAVSLHSGSCFGGHYTAYVVDNNGQYWNCNDSHIAKIQSIDLHNPHAYIISYSDSSYC